MWPVCTTTHFGKEGALHMLLCKTAGLSNPVVQF
jgi:hypothetical protein